MAASGARRVTLGFQGGQVLALRVSDQQLEDLNKALGGIGWHELESEDGPVRVDLGQVVYVSADSDEPRVGFGQSHLNLDERLLWVARTRGHTPRAERAVARFSRLGEHGAVWLAIGVAGAVLDRERGAEWRRATATVTGVFVLNTAIKQVIRRRRPELPGLPALTGTPTALSFPSAHAATSFAGARLYARLGLPAGPLYALATGLSLSRLYLGVHYPSDVLAGVALGTLVGSVRSQ